MFILLVDVLLSDDPYGVLPSAHDGIVVVGLAYAARLATGAAVAHHDLCHEDGVLLASSASGVFVGAGEGACLD